MHRGYGKWVWRRTKQRVVDRDEKEYDTIRGYPLAKLEQKHPCGAKSECQVRVMTHVRREEDAPPRSGGGFRGEGGKTPGGSL